LKQGRPLPEKIENAPVLLPGLDVFYNAFLELSTCRAHGMGVLGPIPWTAISAYAEYEGFTSEQDFDLFVLYIRDMDREFLKHMSKKLNTKTK